MDTTTRKEQDMQSTTITLAELEAEHTRALRTFDGLALELVGRRNDGRSPIARKATAAYEAAEDLGRVVLSVRRLFDADPAVVSVTLEDGRTVAR